MSTEIKIDALLPPEMARRAEFLGVRKSEMAALTTFLLAILAGAFIGLGAIFATTAASGAGALPYGVGRVLTGVVFCVGLILVVVGGAELFTGNNMIIMAWASKKITTRALLRNWLIVYIGNFIGSLGTAMLVFLSGQYKLGAGVIGQTALTIATSKAGLSFTNAIFLGILCNALVCMAVWMTYGARTTTDKIMAIIFPISAFVAAGFEHSIANMYFIPVGLFIKYFDAPWVTSIIEKAAASNVTLNFDKLTWGNFFINNLIPVTIGNIIGGAGLVALVYWAVYLRNTD